jgi:hypothetical protein
LDIRISFSESIPREAAPPRLLPKPKGRLLSIAKPADMPPPFFDLSMISILPETLIVVGVNHK